MQSFTILQIEEIFKWFSFHTFFGSFSFFNPFWRGLAFFIFFILFLIQSWRFVNKNPSIIKPRQFLIKSGQLTALEKQWNLRRNSRQQALDILPFIGQFIPVCEWTISCCFFYGLRRSKNSRKRCEISAVDLEKPQIE